jgi:glycerol-3-phosphate acyltransferase PlsY
MTIRIIIILISYFLGSIPFALLLTKLMGKGDIRKVGSGNVGATNVMRVAGISGFLITWLFDMGKAVAAVLIGRHFFGFDFGILCGASAILGHIYPVWLGFRGGKGVSASFGFMLAMSPFVFVVQGFVWLGVAMATKYSSLAAWINWILLPVFGFMFGFWTGAICIFLAIIGLYSQRANIRRFINGNESKMQVSVGKLAVALFAIGLLAAVFALFANGGLEIGIGGNYV